MTWYVSPFRLWFCVALSIVVVLDAARVRAADGSPRAAAARAESSEDRSTDDDVKALQGGWEYTYKNDAGATFRVVKQVEDGVDVVTHFDAQGNTIHSHTSNFELSEHGPFRVFTITNRVVTAGADNGAQSSKRLSYAYRVEGDRMIEVWGLLAGDRGAPRTIVWNRIKKN